MDGTSGTFQKGNTFAIDLGDFLRSFGSDTAMSPRFSVV